MMERDVGGVHTTLRRDEGITVADILNRLYPPKVKGWFRKKLEPQTFPESVDLRFENIPLCEVSPDRTHVLAVGDDGERLYLIRDNQILHTALKEEVSEIEILQKGKDFNRLMFRTNHQTGGGAIHIVNQHGEVLTPLTYSDKGRFITYGNENGALRMGWGFSWYDTFLLAAQDADKTRLVVCDGEGNVTRSIEVPETHDVNNIRVEGADDDFSEVVWQVCPSEEEVKLGARSYVYLDDQLLGEDTDYQQVRCSPGLSRVLIYTNNLLTRISMNDRQVFPQSPEEESGKIIGHACNEDLTVAAFAIKVEEMDVRVFYVTPEGEQVYDESFKDVKRLRVGQDNLITAEVIRNGVPWTLTIDPQKQPSAATVVQSST